MQVRPFFPSTVGNTALPKYLPEVFPKGGGAVSFPIVRTEKVVPRVKKTDAPGGSIPCIFQKGHRTAG